MPAAALPRDTARLRTLLFVEMGDEAGTQGFKAPRHEGVSYESLNALNPWALCCVRTAQASRYSSRSDFLSDAGLGWVGEPRH